ncbi:conserved hypothetical protein [Hyphomicrobiales bacterium]|nr:conserved hypothetical protein [Hyphomicrobiales bacterium]CAH1698005.1 conserved hypothetical protein [Hyphomicrobiales bacterium]CAI0347648.1 conserved hypothetical protein [Hyphomicrobiales bacterium]
MLQNSLAPAARALLFFGVMGAAVSGLTLGAQWQMPTDQSSTTVAQARGERDLGADLRFAAVDHADRAQSTAKRASASPSQHAMADSPIARILR